MKLPIDDARSIETKPATTKYLSKTGNHALRGRIHLSFSLAKAVPKRTIARPAIIIDVTFSPRKAAPHNRRLV
jgi:hypothetical protein